MPWVQDISKRNSYYRDTAAEPPSSFVLKALRYGPFKTALDLGCGSGVDTREMVKNGIEVTAVDINEEVKAYINDPRIELVIAPFQNFTFGKYDLIYAKSSIVFLNHKDFYKVIHEIKNALNPGGVCALRLWGKKHSYSSSPKVNYVFMDRDEVVDLLSELEMLDMVEREKDGTDVNGKLVHRHFLDVIARKPASV